MVSRSRSRPRTISPDLGVRRRYDATRVVRRPAPPTPRAATTRHGAWGGRMQAGKHVFLWGLCGVEIHRPSQKNDAKTSTRAARRATKAPRTASMRWSNSPHTSFCYCPSSKFTCGSGKTGYELFEMARRKGFFGWEMGRNSRSRALSRVFMRSLSAHSHSL